MKNKKFSLKDRIAYHRDRDRNYKKYGIKYGSPRYSYSIGFSDGIDHLDNSASVKREFGSRSARAYNFGRKRGKIAAAEYFKKYGKSI